MGLDAFDGMAARKLDQCSRFGAAQDMVSDRTSCASIYTVLMMIYPEPQYSYLFMTCFFLDFGSHFLKFCTGALMKSESHKRDNDKESNFVVYYYYSNYYFFISLVTFSEVASVLLVLMRRCEAFRASQIAWAFTTFCCANLTLKMIINVYQWKGAVAELRKY